VPQAGDGDAGDGQAGAVGREGGGGEAAVAAGADGQAEGGERLAAGHVPEADGFVLGDGHQGLAVGREHGAGDGVGVAAGVEDQHGAVLVVARQLLGRALDPHGVLDAAHEGGRP